MKLTFVYTETFTDACRDLRVKNEDLEALEFELLDDPEAGNVMPGCGGLRKLRFSPPSMHRGKSGAARVVYGYFARQDHVYLILIYAKNERENVSAAEKKRFRELTRQIANYLETHQ